MLRRISIALCALWLLLGVSALQAQTAKNQRIGILAASAAAASEPNMEALRRRLAELGYREGQNIVFESRTAEGKRERLPALAAELVQLKLDAIIAVGTDAALATEEATASIPIIVVEGPAQPGGNVTGFTQPPRDIIGKLVGNLREAAPRAKRVAILINTKDPGAGAMLEEGKAAASALGVKLEIAELARAEDAAAAFAAIRKSKPDALIVTLSAPLPPKSAADFALKARLPAIYERREFVEAGGLMSYSAKQPEMFRQAAGYVVRVLHGAKPASLPVAQPTSFALVINQKTAKALRLTIAPALLKRADDIIK